MTEGKQFRRAWFGCKLIPTICGNGKLTDERTQLPGNTIDDQNAALLGTD